MKKTMMCMYLGCLLFAPAVFATPATDELMAQYKAQGAGKPDAAKARQDWTRKVQTEDGELACATCHGTDLTRSGEHHKTHKVIEPMSRKVNAERFTDVKKIEKWFKRNCKDTWGRECTPQEKTDFLTFLLAQ
ncbi:MAG: DUF1924 domain-containing protein [Sideroxydans sp.]